jgi:predicted nucleic acid-binding protein
VQAILDTPVFIAREQERPLGVLPDQVAVSVVTLSELRYGVLDARATSRWREGLARGACPAAS